MVQPISRLDIAEVWDEVAKARSAKGDSKGAIQASESARIMRINAYPLSSPGVAEHNAFAQRRSGFGW